MTCLKCKHEKWSHWSEKEGLKHCTIEGCECIKYSGRIDTRNVRRELEKKYNIIRKEKIKHEIM